MQISGGAQINNTEGQQRRGISKGIWFHLISMKRSLEKMYPIIRIKAFPAWGCLIKILMSPTLLLYWAIIYKEFLFWTTALILTMLLGNTSHLSYFPPTQTDLSLDQVIMLFLWTIQQLSTHPSHLCAEKRALRTHGMCTKTLGDVKTRAPWARKRTLCRFGVYD